MKTPDQECEDIKNTLVRILTSIRPDLRFDDKITVTHDANEQPHCPVAPTARITFADDVRPKVRPRRLGDESTPPRRLLMTALSRSLVRSHVTAGMADDDPYAIEAPLQDLYASVVHDSTALSAAIRKDYHTLTHQNQK